MIYQDIIQKIQEAGLRGRGGAGFSAHLKWEAVKNAPGEKKYVICNAAEGEPGVSKDGFLLENHPAEVIQGIRIAVEFLGAAAAFIYLRKDYYDKFQTKLKDAIGDLPIKLFKKTSGYLGGEETVLLEDMEGRRPEPREKPPYPTERGLYGCPTLINNAETFYDIARIAAGKYERKRFYSLSGDIRHPGVYELPEDWGVGKILQETDNWPEADFFVQSGGGASGEILTSAETDKPVGGAGAIIVYDRQKTNPVELMRRWTGFYLRENCGQCVPCREGVCRLNEILTQPEINWELLRDILFSLRETSFCALGNGVAAPFVGLLEKIIKNQSDGR